MVLLVLLACECESDLDNSTYPNDADRFSTAGTVNVCAGEVPTRLALGCVDGEAYLFVGSGMDATTLAVESGGRDGDVDRALDVYGCTIELRDLTITGAHVQESIDCPDGGGECTGLTGGAIFAFEAEVTLTRVRVTGNEADHAGAGDLYDSHLLVTDSEITDNRGGGFALRGERASLVSAGTAWSGHVGRDVILSDRSFDADGASDFTCDTERCEER